jgi:hypothetical protein
VGIPAPYKISIGGKGLLIAIPQKSKLLNFKLKIKNP